MRPPRIWLATTGLELSSRQINRKFYSQRPVGGFARDDRIGNLARGDWVGIVFATMDRNFTHGGGIGIYLETIDLKLACGGMVTASARGSRLWLPPPLTGIGARAAGRARVYGCW